jgi:hypothetical protein
LFTKQSKLEAREEREKEREKERKGREKRRKTFIFYEKKKKTMQKKTIKQ